MRRCLTLAVATAAVAVALPLSAPDPADAAQGTFYWWFEADQPHGAQNPPAGQCFQTGGEAVWARNNTTAPVVIYVDRFCSQRIGTLEQGYDHPTPAFSSFSALG